jgi:hypothetical protein
VQGANAFVLGGFRFAVEVDAFVLKKQNLCQLGWGALQAENNNEIGLQPFRGGLKKLLN